MKDQIDFFRCYYQEIFRPEMITLPDFKFHHFRFQIFSKSKKKKFVRLKDIIQSNKQLFQKISNLIPENAYFTPTKWLNPIFVGKKKEEIDIMLSSSLYFDIDSPLLESSSFEKAKIDTQRLIDLIDYKYNRSPDLVVFSGRRGFHVYYWEWDTPKLIKMHPRDRIKTFVVERKKILKEISTEDIVVDKRVTEDPYRIMRIPGTLHGSTGLVAKNIVDPKAFNPLKDALVFDPDVYSEILKVNLSDIFSKEP